VDRLKIAIVVAREEMWERSGEKRKKKQKKYCRRIRVDGIVLHRVETSIRPDSISRIRLPYDGVPLRNTGANGNRIGIRDSCRGFAWQWTPGSPWVRRRNGMRWANRPNRRCQIARAAPISRRFCHGTFLSHCTAVGKSDINRYAIVIRRMSWTNNADYSSIKNS